MKLVLLVVFETDSTSACRDNVCVVHQMSAITPPEPSSRSLAYISVVNVREDLKRTSCSRVTSAQCLRIATGVGRCSLPFRGWPHTVRKFNLSSAAVSVSKCLPLSALGPCTRGSTPTSLFPMKWKLRGSRFVSKESQTPSWRLLCPQIALPCQITLQNRIFWVNRIRLLHAQHLDLNANVLQNPHWWTYLRPARHNYHPKV